MAYAADTLRDRASEQVIRLHGAPEHVTIIRCALFRRRRSATAASLLAGDSQESEERQRARLRIHESVDPSEDETELAYKTELVEMYPERTQAFFYLPEMDSSIQSTSPLVQAQEQKESPMLRFARLAAFLVGKDFGAGFFTTAAPRGHDSDGGEGQFPGLRGRRGRAEGLQVLLQPRGE